MPGKLKIRKLNGSTPVDTGFNNPDGSSSTYGVVGGLTSLTDQQVVANVAIARSGTGTVSSATTSNALSGTSTAFDDQLAVGSVVTTIDGTLIGYVDTVTDADSVVLTANAAVATSGAAFVYATAAAGHVLRQKGKRKFLVADGTSINDEDMVVGESYRILSAGSTDWAACGAGPDAAAGKIFTAIAAGSGTGTVNLVGQCKTANATTANLLPSTMNILATKTSGTTYLDSMTSHHAIDFTAAGGVNDNAGTHFYASFNGAVAASASAGRPYMVVDVQST